MNRETFDCPSILRWWDEISVGRDDSEWSDLTTRGFIPWELILLFDDQPEESAIHQVFDRLHIIDREFHGLEKFCRHSCG
jgi:hypothetical protein